MTLHDSVRDRLRAIEALLRETEHWQETAPDSSAFASDKPFCLDTLEPLEWLQWVLIPRMHQLLESGQPLPQNFAVCALLRNGSGSGPPGPRIHAGGTSAVRRAVCR